MKAIVILNPYAGRWTALQRKSEAEAALQAAGVDFEIVITEGAGHGMELAKNAVSLGFNPIIAAGGDGSISEVVNGLFASEIADQPPALGILPLGSANDLVDNLKLPRDLPLAAKVIAAGKTRLLDIGQVNGRYFDNNTAIGLEPYITLIQQRMTRLKGNSRYLVAALKGIWNNPKWIMHLQWDAGEYHGPVNLVTVGNTPRTGGIFFTTPHADPFDGKLTFVYGYIESRFEIFRIMPRMMKPGPGSYVEHPQVHEIHTTWLKVISERPTPAHADGEIISRTATELEYRVLAARLPVLMG